MSAAPEGPKRITYEILRVHRKVTEDDMKKELRAYMARLALGNSVFCCVERVEFELIDGGRFKKAIVYHHPIGRWCGSYKKSMNTVKRIMDDIYHSNRSGKPLKVWPAGSRHFWMLLPNRNPRHQEEQKPPQLTAKELVGKINDMEDCIMSNYYDYSNTCFSGKCKAMIDEIAERYRKDIKVDETSFAADSDEELIKKLNDRLKDLTRLNEVVYDSCDDFYLWEQYE